MTTAELMFGVGMRVVSPPRWSSVFGKELKMKRGLQNRNRRLEKAAQAIMSGHCNLEIYRDIGVSPKTTRKLRHVLALHGVNPKCLCGRPAAHWAYCKERKMAILEG